MSNSEKPVYGIDLGTTNSCVARVQSGEPTVYPNDDGKLTSPSVVYFESPEKLVVGDHALEELKVSPDSVAEMFKRYMGQPCFPRSGAGKEALSDPSLDPFKVGSKIYAPEEASAVVLRKLVADVAETGGGKVERVVITVPAYFKDTQKERTRDAGRIAGLDVVRVVEEPVAAAIAYGVRSDQHETVLVFDLGGGTFDVTILKVGDDTYEAVATGGDAFLGGRDWDRCLVEDMARQLEDKTEVSAEAALSDTECVVELYRCAETLKKALTKKEETHTRVGLGSASTIYEIDRERFNRLTSSLLGLCMDQVRDTIQEAERKIGSFSIDRVLLVGGSTYMPQIKERLQNEFSGVPVDLTDPNLSVCRGAAILGAKEWIEAIDNKGPRQSSELEIARETGLSTELVARLRGAKVENILTKSFGLECMMDSELRVKNHLFRNEKFPVEHADIYQTVADTQRVELRIYANEILAHDQDARGLAPNECTLTGECQLDFPQELERGTPIQVHFRYDEHGVLTVTATEQTTHSVAEVSLKSPGAKTSCEIEQSRQALARTKVGG